VQTLSNSAETRLKRLLTDVRAGHLTVAAAARKLAAWPTEDLGFARLDHHRLLRQGLPEAVLCTGKKPEQVLMLLSRLSEAGTVALATRVPDAWANDLRGAFKRGIWYSDASLFMVPPKGHRKPRGKARTVVASAGTADLPVAEEAAVTVEAHGHAVERLFDVGVAGLHRLLAETEALRRARVVIAVAGMDGALPSVVGGLIGAPVIAVPTSVGYGASFGGIAALLTMLNSCAPGVLTVNIDNGYGAGVAACRILAGR
jgi:NCAIR mutase (PurE)-related protein